MAAFLNYSGSGGSDTAVLQSQIPLLIERQLRTMYGTLDPFFKMMVTSEGLVKNPEISRDWLIRRPIDGQQTAGVVAMDTEATIYGGNVDEMGNTMYRHAKANLASYPDAFEGPHGRPYELQIGLKGLRASLAFPSMEEDLDALPSVIGDNYSRLMEKWARQIVLYRISHFYAADDNGALSDFQFLDANEAYTDPNGTVTLTVTDKNINNFHRGMIVDLYSGSTQVNLLSGARVPCYVESVDHFKETNNVILRYSIVGGNASGLIQGDNAVANGATLTLYLRASYGDSYPGLNTYCKATHITNTGHANYYNPSNGFFNVQLENYPEHGSLVIDAQSQALTETLGFGALMRFQRAREQFGMSLDTCLLRPEAHAAYIKARTPREVLNRDLGNQALRNSRTQGVEGGMTMTFNGLTVTCELTSYLRTGTAFMLKKGDNNFKRYVPPLPSRVAASPPPGFGNGEGLINGMELEFRGQATGHASEFVPIRDGDGEVVDGVQMLARSRSVVHPDQLSMLKIENIAEYDPKIVTA